MNKFKASASLFHGFPLSLSDHTKLVSFHQVRELHMLGNHLLIRRLTDVQGEQTIWLSSIIRLPASFEPPTTHARLISRLSS